VDVDGAVHHLDEVLAQREAEAGALVAAPRRRVDLREGLEDPPVVAVADADAGVLDFEHDELPEVDGLAAHGDGDAAAGGELEGVADQVDEDLAQAAAVELGDDRGRRGAQLEHVAAGARERLQGLGDLARDLLGGEALAPEVELGGLDAREVEDVVDEAEQVLAGADDLDEVVAHVREAVRVGVLD